MSKKLLNKELNRMKVLSGLIKESEEATQKQRVGYLKESLEINGKKVNFGSIEIDNIDQNDYPDFVDAYISYAEFERRSEERATKKSKTCYKNDSFVSSARDKAKKDQDEILKLRNLLQ